MFLPKKKRVVLVAGCLFIGSVAVGDVGQTSSSRDHELGSAQIENIQSALRDEGYDIGSVDGHFGAKTKQAVMKFQRDNGLKATGKLDDATLAALGVAGESERGRGVATTPDDAYGPSDGQIERGGTMTPDENKKPSDEDKSNQGDIDSVQRPTENPPRSHDRY